MNIKSLNSLAVLITRPHDQAVDLICHVENHQGVAFIFPTISIEKIGDKRNLYDAMLNAEIIIFTSTNAVKYASESLNHCGDHCQYFAVGAATKQALQACGINHVTKPDLYDGSEALLELPALQQVDGKNVLIIAGENGRELLNATLSKRGAIVNKIAVYRRMIPTYDMNVLHQFCNVIDNKIIVSTSLESLSNLLNASDNELLSCPLLVISERMADTAKQIGFQQIIIAKNSSTNEIMQSLLNYSEK